MNEEGLGLSPFVERPVRRIVVARCLTVCLLAMSMAFFALPVAAAALPADPSVASERTEALPNDLQDVGITEHLGAAVPVDLPFVDTEGRTIRFGDFLGTRPILLTFNYSSCPMLCSLQLDGLAGALREVRLSLGKDFDVVTIGLDPQEKPERMQATAARYAKQVDAEQVGRPEAASGWHFLRGEETSIAAMAKAVGFRYTYLEDVREYAHAAVAVLLSPQGKVTRYLYGVTYEPKTLRWSLVEASKGQIGSVADQVLLFCYRYDATKGHYAPFARNVMRLGGVLTVLLLGGVVAGFFVRDAKNKKSIK